MKLLSRQDEMILLAAWKLGQQAYGVSIRSLISEVSGKTWSVGAIYTPLENLVEKNYLRSYYGEPSAKRGGKRKKMVRITQKGKDALLEMHRVTSDLWSGIPVSGTETDYDLNVGPPYRRAAIFKHRNRFIWET